MTDSSICGMFSNVRQGRLSVLKMTIRLIGYIRNLGFGRYFIPRKMKDCMQWVTGQELKLFILIQGMVMGLLSNPVSSQVGQVYKDQVYGHIDGKDLSMDIHMPAGVSGPGLLVWVHGGAWRNGTKAEVPMEFIVNGMAVASLDFRQSTEAPFPAAIHDIKAAIRFLRANARKYGVRSKNIVIAGASSGGHLATLVGVSHSNGFLEGNIGSHLKESSKVQGIITYYGASNLLTILSQSTPHGLSVRRPALELLLGALPENAKELAEQASPVFNIGLDDPPLLIFHGDQDNQMPINQAHELKGKYESFNLESGFEVVYGAGHGGKEFFSGQYLEKALSFFHQITK